MTLRLLLLAAVAAAPMPAFAQHAGHAGHDQQTVAPPPAQGAGEQSHAGDHSAHAEPATAAPSDAHEAHHQPSEEPAGAAAGDPPAAHAANEAPAADAHAGHEIGGSPMPPIAEAPAAATTGPENAADLYFGESAMSVARRELGRMHGNIPAYRVLFDRAEAQLRDGPDSYLIDAQAWYGGDIDKLWLKTEGSDTFGGGFEGAEVQALWSHAVGPWFDLQAGAKYDVGRGDDRVHAVLGVQGLAPYWIEIDAAAFLSDRGDVTARIEAEHDARITQRLILQPRLELHLALQDIPEARVGAGLATGSLGARLRYQITPLFSPYIGVEYTRAFGETRDRRTAANEDVGGVSLIAGVRAWF